VKARIEESKEGAEEKQQEAEEEPLASGGEAAGARRARSARARFVPVEFVETGKFGPAAMHNQHPKPVAKRAEADAKNRGSKKKIAGRLGIGELTITTDTSGKTTVTTDKSDDMPHSANCPIPSEPPLESFKLDKTKSIKTECVRGLVFVTCFDDSKSEHGFAMCRSDNAGQIEYLKKRTISDRNKKPESASMWKTVKNTVKKFVNGIFKKSIKITVDDRCGKNYDPKKVDVFSRHYCTVAEKMLKSI
jgi:hypothetical protein